MLLKKINKTRYRRHLNIIIVGCIVFLTVFSLLSAQILISLLSDAQSPHFYHNLGGLVLSALLLGGLLSHYKQHEFMHEVAYVWDLKQQLNKITRKLHRIEKAAREGDENAMLALHFSYTGSAQLWQLDDNNITLEELEKSKQQLQQLCDQYNVQLNIDQYHMRLLKKY
ncbi:hypothetical protein PCNPT3_07275 [Psychromonas sp. CNPT3]|uniref:DUF3087 domain-containing protein n=1 Tax=Psychromonas sp. CNPT3 TaxID=314282 RepID=UPI00006E85B8|nr:DUF3087 domain-containing protein [Psychromonas sp. CNPT3]AGH81393.1 hypothetical protein PCNPT3_07275 [Psychromonas sp. CNPT3]